MQRASEKARRKVGRTPAVSLHEGRPDTHTVTALFALDKVPLHNGSSTVLVPSDLLALRMTGSSLELVLIVLKRGGPRSASASSSTTTRTWSRSTSLRSPAATGLRKMYALQSAALPRLRSRASVRQCRQVEVFCQSSAPL
jgi:hypothetical protein